MSWSAPDPVTARTMVSRLRELSQFHALVDVRVEPNSNIRIDVHVSERFHGKQAEFARQLFRVVDAAGWSWRSADYGYELHRRVD